MGFGLLFIGYFVTYFMTHLMSAFYLGGLVRLIGYLVMLVAVIKLSGYSKGFALTKYAAIAMLVISGCATLMDLAVCLGDFNLLGGFSVPGILVEIEKRVEDVFALGFHALLFYGIMKIAEETDVGKIRIAAIRNFIFMCVCFSFEIVSSIPVDVLRSLSALAILIYFGCLIFNLALLFNCYVKICDEGDVDMPLKKSKVEFVNKLREETARREQKAADESIEYARQRLEKRRSKKSKK